MRGNLGPWLNYCLLPIMKKLLLYIAFLIGIGSFASCVTHSHGRGNKGLPPGQAKKIYGTKSAKPFAPGQNKKKSKKNKNHRIEYYQ